MAQWSIEYEGDAFERFLFSLPEYEQAVLIADPSHKRQQREIRLARKLHEQWKQRRAR